MPLPTLYSKDSVDNLLADKLDLAGGTMTGGLTLSATGIIFSDSTTLTTAPAGGTLAADQLTAGVVATNPAAGPTTAGDVLQYDGTDLIWAAGGGGGGLTISTLSNGATSTLNATAPTTGQYLSFDGTELIWATPSGGATAADQLTAGTVVTNPAAGPTAADEVLTYDGTDLVWAAPVAAVAWGDVTGTLSSQTDLQTALDGKLSAKTVYEVTSNAYTLASGDANNIVYIPGSASGGFPPIQITVPDDATYSFPIGTVIILSINNSVSGAAIDLIQGDPSTPQPTLIGTNSWSNSTSGNFQLIKVAANKWICS